MTQTTIPNSINLIQLIKNVTDKLENSSLSPKTLKTIAPQAAKLAACLNINETNIPIFCVIYILDYIGIDVNLEEIAKYLHVNQKQSTTIQTALNEMVQCKEISSQLPSNSSKSKAVNYKINSILSTAILNNTITLSNELNEPMNIFQFCHSVRELVDYMTDESINYTQLVNTVTNLEITNADLIAVKQLTEYELRLIDRILLYNMFDVLIGWKTGCSFNNCFKPILKLAENSTSEMEAILDGESELISNLLITVRKSETFEDYYLELTPNALLLFLIEDSSDAYSAKTIINSYFNNN
ncbi:MAG: hypothetical protein WCK78_16345 [Paludibacter sp.]